MGRAPCCDKANVKRGPWSPDEDAALKSYVETHGTGGNWIALPRKAGLRRCGKSCRLRWLNYLRPDIKHGGFTEEEDNIICSFYSQMGSRWSVIASQLPGRTDNDVKNYWNTKLKKKLMAGKVTLKTMSDNLSTLDSTPSLPVGQRAQTHNLAFPAGQTQSYSRQSILTDANSGFNKTESLSLDPVQLYGLAFVDGSEFGETSRNNHINVSMSQEGSSISDSSSCALDKKYLSLPENSEAEAIEDLMDFGFGFHYDLVNGLYSQDKAADAAPCYPELADLTYDDIQLQGLNQNLI